MFGASEEGNNNEQCMGGIVINLQVFLISYAALVSAAKPSFRFPTGTACLWLGQPGKYRFSSCGKCKDCQWTNTFDLLILVFFFLSFENVLKKSFPYRNSDFCGAHHIRNVLGKTAAKIQWTGFPEKTCLFWIMRRKKWKSSPNKHRSACGPALARDVLFRAALLGTNV